MEKINYKLIILAIIVLLAVFTFIAMKFSQVIPPSGGVQVGLFFPEDKEITAKGKELYLANCSSCHGVNLEGAPNWRSPDESGLMPAPPHDESGHTWHHKDELLFNIVKYGLEKAANLDNYETNMPIYENILSDEEIIAIMSYIKSSWPKEIIERHNQFDIRE